MSERDQPDGANQPAQTMATKKQTASKRKPRRASSGQGWRTTDADEIERRSVLAPRAGLGDNTLARLAIRREGDASAPPDAVATVSEAIERIGTTFDRQIIGISRGNGPADAG